MPEDVTRTGYVEFLLLGVALVLAGGAGIGLSEVRIGGVLAIVGVVICLRPRRERPIVRSVVASPYRNAPGARARTEHGRGGAEVLLAGLLVLIGVLGLALHGTSRPAAAGLELIALLVGVRLLYMTCTPPSASAMLMHRGRSSVRTRKRRT